MPNNFFEPERGTGVMGWALRQLVFYLVGGFFVVWLIAGHGGFQFPAPAVAPQAESAPAAAAAAPAAPTSAPVVLGRPVATALNALSLRARADGYVYVNAEVNGAPMLMAFDTGASMVSLTQADALKAGVAGSLNYSLQFGTANGHARGAPVVLRGIRIGGLEIDDINAVVMQNLNVSLLGQSFLRRLESYQMRDGVLTLSWR